MSNKNKQELNKNIYELIREISGVEVEKCTNLIDDLSFDSIQIIMLFAGIEDIYNIEIDFEKIDFTRYTEMEYLTDFLYKIIFDEN